MTGVILAGGKSRRMEKNKALLKIGKKQVIKLVIEKLKIVFDNNVLLSEKKGCSSVCVSISSK